MKKKKKLIALVPVTKYKYRVKNSGFWFRLFRKNEKTTVNELVRFSNRLLALDFFSRKNAEIQTSLDRFIYKHFMSKCSSLCLKSKLSYVGFVHSFDFGHLVFERSLYTASGIEICTPVIRACQNCFQTVSDFRRQGLVLDFRHTIP